MSSQCLFRAEEFYPKTIPPGPWSLCLAQKARTSGGHGRDRAFLLHRAWKGADADSPVPETAMKGLNHHLSGKTSTELMPLYSQPMAQKISQASFQIVLWDWSQHKKIDSQIHHAHVLPKIQFFPGFHLLRLFQKDDNASDFWMQPLVVHCLSGSVQVKVNYLKYLHGTTPGKGVSADHANQLISEPSLQCHFISCSITKA